MIFEQRLNDDGKPYIYMNTGNLAELNKPDLEQFKCFHVTTYDLLKRVNDPIAWNVVFKPVNDFISLLTDNEKTVLGLAFIEMHYDIINYLGSDKIDETFDENKFAENIDKLTDSLSRIIGQMDSVINLVPKLIDFVSNNIPIGDYKTAGTEPQDTPEMTFYRPDVIVLTSIVIFCKLLTPIFGIIIHYCAKIIDSDLKVFHCFVILKNVIVQRYRDIYAKLIFYLTKIIEPSLKSEEILLAFNAYTINMLTLSSMAYLLTRRFISVDIYTPEGNLMIYIMSCTKSFIKTLNSNTSRKNAAKSKNDPDEIKGDEGNLSRLENESRNSKTTADIPIIIKVITEQIINYHYDNLTEAEKEIYHKTVEYYSINHVLPNKFNKFMLALFFGYDLCGAQSIEFLNIKQYIKLIAILQIQLFKKELYSLILPLSMIKTEEVKHTLSNEDQMIKINWNSFAEYKQCESLFVDNCGDLGWNSILIELVEFLVNNAFIYNTSEQIWDILKLDNYNNYTVKYQDNLFKNIYKLILSSYSNINDIFQRSLP